MRPLKSEGGYEDTFRAPRTMLSQSYVLNSHGWLTGVLVGWSVEKLAGWLVGGLAVGLIG